MEEILGQNMRTPINLKQFLVNYQEMFKHPYTIPTTDINIQNAMQLTEEDERYKTIQENCSLNHLKSQNDHRVADFIPGCSEIQRKANAVVDLNAIKLKSFDLLSKHKTLKKPTAFQRTRDSFTMMKIPSVQADSLNSLQPGEEMIIYIRFYRPARATHIGRTLERPAFSQEIVCLGRNLLSEMRDKIYCVCNNRRFFDISEDPNAPLPTKDTDPGFFFITDTFYNDKRNPLNMDYSETIRSWAKKAKGLSNIEFKVALLEQTRFIDLTLSLGFPQLYQHHGNCEHVFVFSNIEIITNPSIQLLPSLSCYPFVISITLFDTRTCNICGKMNYVFVVEGSNRQLQDPAYLCKQCFLSFHYVDGKKIGEFYAYRLIDELTTPSEEICNNDEETPAENGNDNICNDVSSNNGNDNNDIDSNVCNDDSNENIKENSEIFEVFDIIVKEETTCNVEDNSYV